MTKYSIPIHDTKDFTPIWYNFLRNVLNGKYPEVDLEKKPTYALLRVLANRYKGEVVSDNAVFESEQDKMWFILNHSS